MNQIAKDCAANLERRMLAQEVFDGYVESEMDDQIIAVRNNPTDWILSWVADTDDVLAQMFVACATYSDNLPETRMKLGQVIKSIFNREVETAAKFIVEQRND